MARSAHEHRRRPAVWDAEEDARDAAAARDAVRSANARGPGVNLEETIRMIRAGEAVHGVARR